MLVLATAPVWAQASLRSRVDLAVNDLPTAVLVADVDGDTYLDLISVNQGTNNVGDLQILKGFGDGTFRVVRSVTAGSVPTGAALADTNGDGRADLVVSNLRSQEVTVSFGDGFGNFGSMVRTSVSGTPNALAVGDWNNDGIRDVATANAAQNTISALRGDGSGRFTGLRLLATGSSPKSIVAADFNLDGRQDLAVANNLGNTIQVFRGDGLGGFALSNTLTTGGSPQGLATADLNADGRPDLVAANFTSDNVGIYLATSTGFAAPATVSSGFGPRGVAIADLSKDGRLDLVITQSKVSNVGAAAVLIGNGAGGFGAPTITNVGPVPVTAAIGDFNRDTNVDVVVVSHTGNVLCLLQNVGSGTFSSGGRIVLPTGSFPHGVTIADFNRDGRSDLASANEASNNVTYCQGDGAGSCASVNSANNTGITPYAMLSVDFNRDNCADIVTVNNGDNTMSYLVNNCAGNFQVATTPLGCEGPVAVARGEISGDANLDVAYVCETPPTESPTCTRMGTGAGGTGAFGAPMCFTMTDDPQGVALGVYTLDAIEDIAVTSGVLGVASVATSDGMGGITDIPASFPVGAGPEGIVGRALCAQPGGGFASCPADLNQDGFTDVVVANSGSGTISALLGDGGGVFSYPSIDSAVGLAPTAIALADYNLDGWMDAAVTNTNSNNIALMLGDGTGRFSSAGFYGVRDAPIAIAAGDLNNDGKPDVVVADNFSDTLSILTNLSVAGDPLAFAMVYDANRTVFRWGMVPGATYDAIRGQVRSVRQTATTYDLGAVVCLGNDLTVTDTAQNPDTGIPPVGDAYFYAVRATVGGVPGNYTVASNGKPGVPASGGCP